MKPEWHSLQRCHIARESYFDVIEEGKKFLHEHWEELSLYPDIPLEPEYEFYEVLAKNNLLAIYTVRVQGEMVGYAVYFIRKHYHYASTKWAFGDIILVRKPYRKFGLGTALFDFIENDLRSEGVAVINTETKIMHPELAMLLRARGHKEATLGFSKRL